MITPELEKMILRGEAEWITYATGGSGVATIPFPKNARMMVVESIFWNPFQDFEVALATSIFEVQRHLIHTMTLWNGKRKHIFNFRDCLAALTSPTNPVVSTPIFQSPTKLDVFVTAKNDIYVDIFRFDDAGLVTVLNDTVVASETQEQQNPDGYAGLKAVRLTVTSSGARIANMGLNRDPKAQLTPPGATGRDRSEYFDDIGFATILNPPASPASTLSVSYNTPLVNFGVVLLYETNNSILA